MMAPSIHLTGVREELAAELTDAAFQVMARHGVQGPSVDQELAVWHALEEALRGRHKGNLVASLTDAAYQVALGYGFRGSFLDLELDLWRGLCQALGETPLARRWSHVLHGRRQGGEE